MAGSNRVFALYKKLLALYGPQGWWPIIKSGAVCYHPGDYRPPQSANERFQVIIGALLAQGINWKNAEKALLSLYNAGTLSADALAKMPETRLAGLIKSAGYYNQKARTIRNFLQVYRPLLKCRNGDVMRKMLLSVTGIGPETADSILLYAFKRPFFVVDAYTRRFCTEHGLCDFQDYEDYRAFFEKSLPRDYMVYNEYHALMVLWGKRKKYK